MSFIEFKNICKKYAGNDKNSVTDFNLDIEEKEFINETGIIDYKEKLNDMQFFKDDDCKRYSVVMKPKNNSHFDDMPQHFLKGKIGLADLISRIVIGRVEYPCNLMYFVITPNNKKTSSEIMGGKIFCYI